jgi:hypothetical protein
LRASIRAGTPQQDFADLLAQLRAARLARHQVGKSQPAEIVGQQVELRALAAAVNTFEGQEETACGPPCHRGSLDLVMTSESSQL